MRQAAILKAEGDSKAAVLRAEGEAQAITTVFGAIHAGDADPKLLAYQYLLTLPKLAEGSANKLWVIPSELTEALKGIGSGFSFGAGASGPSAGTKPAPTGADE
jgi:regulator of protease activity HflC (stomatin/prohibitin superfamily)